MKVKVAYSGYDGIGEVIEFEFDWDSVSPNVVSAEEANQTQIHLAVQEALYQETEREEPIASTVILDGDPYIMLKNLS